MKKLFLAMILLSSPAFADDLVARLAVAAKEAKMACQLRDDLAILTTLSARRTYFQNPFSDADFTTANISYVTAYNAGGLFDFVVADLNTALAANGNRDLQILEQMCGD